MSNIHTQRKFPKTATEMRVTRPVSSEISDICDISDLLLFVSYFASQSEGIKFGDYFMICVVQTKFFWIDVRYAQQVLVRD